MLGVGSFVEKEKKEKKRNMSERYFFKAGRDMIMIMIMIGVGGGACEGQTDTHIERECVGGLFYRGGESRALLCHREQVGLLCCNVVAILMLWQVVAKHSGLRTAHICIIRPLSQGWILLYCREDGDDQRRKEKGRDEKRAS